VEPKMVLLYFSILFFYFLESRLSKTAYEGGSITSLRREQLHKGKKRGQDMNANKEKVNVNAFPQLRFSKIANTQHKN
jgi:hypothetical protein